MTNSVLCLRLTGLERLRNSFVGDTLLVEAFAGVASVPELDDDVTDPATSVPLIFASARGSIDLRRRWPPRGTRDVSIAYAVSTSHLFSRSQSSTQLTPTQVTMPPLSRTFSRVLFPPSLKTTCVIPTFRDPPDSQSADGFQFHC